MSETPEERLTRLETQMDYVERTVGEIKSDLQKVVAAVNMSRGAWWVIVKFCGAALAIGGAVAWLVDYFSRGGTPPAH